MASTTPANPTQTSSPNLAPMQGVYMMPMPQQVGKPRVVRPVPGVLCLSISTIILASILALVGIAAAVLGARYAYLGNPIWTGILFLLTTGIMGIFVHKKRNSFCMNIAFFIMTIISTAASFQLFCYILDASTRESNWRCSPQPDYYYSYNYPDICGPMWARVLVDIIIVLCSLATTVLCVISFSMTLYGTFTCCYTCCYGCCNTSPTTMVQYSPNTGLVMTPMNGQNMHVMAPAHMIPQGSVSTQQASSQPYLASSPQAFTHNAPPAYMAVPNISATPPQAFIVSGSPVPSGGIAYTPPSSSNPPANTQDVENKPPTTGPGTNVQDKDNTDSSVVAGNPQNWQKF